MPSPLTPELVSLRHRVDRFVQDKVIPMEGQMIAEDRQGQDGTLRGLMAQARAEGLWTPHLPPAYGGLGLGVLGMCALFEVMGRSPLGARVFNCDAPDQGNMELLLSVGTEAQKARYLTPLVRAEITSAFAMTEPAPGAGADPSNLLTAAERVPGGWSITGRKWYTTGGRDAAFLIVMARTGERSATLFLVPREAKGLVHVREIPGLAEPVFAHRESEFALEGVFVPDEAVLGGVDRGFELAQVRLVPARLTHCMRWLGWADRALHLCRDYLSRRVNFGQPLARWQGIQLRIAQHATALHAGHLMTWACAEALVAGDPQARFFSSMCKDHVARALCDVLDDAIQFHGALGHSADLPFGDWYRQARAARIADGPDEVHQWVVGRAFLEGKLDLLKMG